MIRVNITKDKDGDYKSFVCKGHADYAEAGSDIVCAGVSAIVINTINCITDLVRENIDLTMNEKEGGYIAVSFREKPDRRTDFLIDCMVHGFDWIIAQYGTSYLKYEIREAEKC